MKPLILDIETGPDDQAIQRLGHKIEPDKRLKDQTKIEADLRNKAEKYKAESALRAERGRIICIGMLQADTVEILEGSEKDMLPRAWERIRGAHNAGCVLVGHNIVGFDLPFLARRSMLLGIHVPSWVGEGLRRDAMVNDTMLIWACGVYGERISLRDLGIACGFAAKDDIGPRFSAVYAEHRDQALQYLDNDLRLTEAVFNQITGWPSRSIRDDEN